MRVLSMSRLGVAVALLVAVGVAVGVVASRPAAAPGPTPTPVSVSTIESCHLPDSEVKGGATLNFTWQLAVRQDSPEVSVLLFTSGSSVLTCETWRGADGNFGASAVTSIGGWEPRASDQLTYETANEPATSQTGSAMVIGRAPNAAASIEIVTSDGERHMATVGSGFYLAWVTATPGADIVEIDARDSSGNVVARLADPSGLEPGGAGVPASN